MLNKRNIVIALCVLALGGSLFTAFASNLFFGDIVNISAGFAHSTLFVTLPAVGVALSFVLGTLYLIRVYKHPDCVKRISRLYAILLAAFNCVGLLGCILAGAITYKTFVGPNPFPGYLIIFMILNLLLCAAGVCGFLYSRKLQDDEGKVEIKFLYVLKTIGWVLFILLAYNRFGTFLMMPAYVYLRNLYMTFPYYLWLLVPLCLGVLQVLYILGIVDKKKLFLLAVIVSGVNLCLFVYTVIIAANNSAFIASISQTMPLDRLASKPLEVLIHILSYLGVGAALIVQAKKQDKE